MSLSNLVQRLPGFRGSGEIALVPRFLGARFIHRCLAICGILALGLIVWGAALVLPGGSIVVPTNGNAYAAIPPGLNDPAYAEAVATRWLLLYYTTDPSSETVAATAMARADLLDPRLGYGLLSRHVDESESDYVSRLALSFSQRAQVTSVRAERVGADGWQVHYEVLARVNYASMSANWWRYRGRLLLRPPGNPAVTGFALGVAAYHGDESICIDGDPSAPTHFSSSKPTVSE